MLLAPYSSTVHSKYFRMPMNRSDEIQRMFCLEAIESYRTRGMIYRSCSDFEAARAQVCDVEALERSATTLYLLGGDKRVHWDLQHIVPVHIPDAQFRKVQFLLYLSENHAYGIFATRITSYNVCYTKLLRLFLGMVRSGSGAETAPEI